MLSRRELLSAGFAGSLATESGTAVEEQPADREGQREIAKYLQGMGRELSEINANFQVVQGPVGKIREYMETFARSNSKFPDFMEVGIAIFVSMYDWHVKNRQQLVVTRQTDGRYFMQFMFTSLILRTDQDRNFIGLPYDRA